MAAVLLVQPVAAQPAPSENETSSQPDGAETGSSPSHAHPPTVVLGSVPIWQRGMSLLGLAALLGIAWLTSTHRRKVPWRVIGWGLTLQLGFGVFVMKTPVGASLFGALNRGVVKLLTFTDEGARFIFGPYLDREFTVALNVLPTIIFFSSLMAILYHLGLMQRVVQGIAWAMRRTMQTTGSETLSAAANIFVGQTEAPLVVRPFISTMTLSELHAVMVGGFATVAGGVLAAYVGMLRDVFPDIGGHLIAASVMSAPAALVVAKVMVPETESPSADPSAIRVTREDANVIDAAARGATQGLKLALNVGAMLLAFLGLIALLNYLLGLPVEAWNEITDAHVEPLTLQRVLGWIFWPVAFLMGVPPEDCGIIGSLLGERIVLNEFVAYLHLAETLESGPPLQHRSVVIATYALCGFANFGSVAIQLGGIGSIAPERRGDLARLGLRAMFGGMLAACMTATVAGMLA